MAREEKQDYLYKYCDGRDGKCEDCILNKSEHMWLTPCEDDCNCPSFLELSEYELDKAIKLIQESEELDKAHNTDKLVDAVNHPSHYTDGKIEVIDYIEDKKLNFNRGNAIKYISRAGKKDKDKEVEDLQKAVFYINREINRLKEV
jgi:hypothetical protein